MNILFLYSGEILPERGGVQRVTSVLADEFARRGNGVFYLSLPAKASGVAFSERQFFLPENDFAAEKNRTFFLDFLKDKKIDVVINQGGNGKDCSRLAYAAKENGVPVVSVCHCGLVDSARNFRAIHEAAWKRRHLDWLLPLTDFRFAKKILLAIYKRKYREHYRELCEKSDRVVLLSESFKPEMAFYFDGEHCPENVVAISNPCSFPPPETTPNPAEKRKELLFCGRIDFSQKRVDLMLEIWRRLFKAFPDWCLTIVGGGAALYPQVTSNGDECHNEWEITFEEIHRNNIIIHAITRHASTTGSMDYIAACGLEVMIAICRYWSRRVSFSEQRGQYVILGVTGPDEYQNNVDNNWYTNYSCVQCLKSTLKAIRLIAAERPEDYARICRTTGFNPAEESARWEDIIRRMYLPEDKERGIFVQNDGFMDKELRDTSAIPPEERPLNQHWSWDRILRSCYIKQADVLLGLYLYGRNFDTDTLRRNFRFYAPMTVHESSLSPHIHSILAARIGDMEQAYNLFMHATRMDLDDYNNEAEQGLHVTSMPGAWMALVSGFLQTYVIDGTLCLSPRLPSKWQGYALRLNFRKRTLRVRVTKEGTDITLLEGEPLTVRVCGEERMVGG